MLPVVESLYTRLVSVITTDTQDITVFYNTICMDTNNAETFGNIHHLVYKTLNYTKMRKIF